MSSMYPTHGDPDLDLSGFGDEPPSHDGRFDPIDVVVGCDNHNHPLRFERITDASTEVRCNYQVDPGRGYEGQCGHRMWHPVTRLEMPYSEVCMHMKIAGKPMLGVLITKVGYHVPDAPGEKRTDFRTWTSETVQLYTLEGQPFSFPITKGEAGWPR